MNLELLLDWCAENDVYIDPRISVCYDISRGVHVVSKSEPIPQNTTCKFIESFAL